MFLFCCAEPWRFDLSFHFIFHLSLARSLAGFFSPFIHPFILFGKQFWWYAHYFLLLLLLLFLSACFRFPIHFFAVVENAPVARTCKMLMEYQMRKVKHFGKMKKKKNANRIGTSWGKKRVYYQISCSDWHELTFVFPIGFSFSFPCCCCYCKRDGENKITTYAFNLTMHGVTLDNGHLFHGFLYTAYTID